MIEDGDVRNYRPLFVLDDRGVMRYGDAPLMAAMPDRDPTLLALNLIGQAMTVPSPD
jgi:hypothetical protein